MHPKNHLIISAAFSFLLAVWLSQDILLWTAVGILAGTLMDVDHLILLLIYDRKSFRKALTLRTVDQFNAEFKKHRHFHAAKNIAHAIQGIIALGFYLGTGLTLLIPIFATMFLHLVTDLIPQVWTHLALNNLKNKYNSCSNCRSTKDLEVHGKPGVTKLVLVCKKCHMRLHKLPDPHNSKIMNALSSRKKVF